MRIRVTRHPRPGTTQDVEVGDGATAQTVVRGLGLHPDAVLVVRDGAAIPLDAALADGDALRVIVVASGG